MLKEKALNIIAVGVLFYSLSGCAHNNKNNLNPVNPPIEREYKSYECLPIVKECKSGDNTEKSTPLYISPIQGYQFEDYINREKDEEKFSEWMENTHKWIEDKQGIIDEYRTHKFLTTTIKGGYKKVEIEDKKFPGWKIEGKESSVEIERIHKF